MAVSLAGICPLKILFFQRLGRLELFQISSDNLTETFSSSIEDIEREA